MGVQNAISWLIGSTGQGHVVWDILGGTGAVEANEMMLRIVWRHRWLLAITILLPMLIVLPLRLAQPVTYTATADVQAEVAAPSASTQVTSILSQVSAIATSPSVVQKAIDAAKVDRNAVDVAKHQISATSLDSSAIVALTVKDPNRQVAVRLGQALATTVVAALNAPGTAASQQLATLAAQKTDLTASRDSLLKQLNTAQASNLATTDPQVQALITELAGVETQLSANQAAEQQVISNGNVSQDASAISEPTAATVTAASKEVAVYVALAGLLGLIIGLLIATVDELARPTVAEPEVAARELGVAFLGNAEFAEEDQVSLDGDLVSKLHVVANRLGALTLVLTGPTSAEQLSQLAATLNRRLSAAADLRDAETQLRSHDEADTVLSAARNLHKKNGSTAVKAHALTIGSALSTLKVHAFSELTLNGRPEAPALILVIRRFAPRASLDRFADLGETTGWPILGVVGYRQDRKPPLLRSAPKSSPAAGTKSYDVSMPTTVYAAQKVFTPKQPDQQGYAR